MAKNKPTGKVEEYVKMIDKEEKPAVAEELNPLTAKQAEIARVIMSSDKEWETITEESMVDFSLSKPAYPLPKEAEELEKKREFAYRYIENDLARLQEVMRKDVPFRWWPCNSTNTPYLQKYIDRSDGAVHCQDQILVFKPWWMHEEYKKLVSGESTRRDRQAILEAKHGAKSEFDSEWTAGKDAKIAGRDEVMEVAEDM